MEIIRTIEVFERNSENDFIIDKHFLQNLDINLIIQFFDIRVFNEDTGEEDEPDYEMVFDYEIYPYHESIFTKLYPDLSFDCDKCQYFFSSFARDE